MIDFLKKLGMGLLIFSIILLSAGLVVAFFMFAPVIFICLMVGILIIYGAFKLGEAILDSEE